MIEIYTKKNKKFATFNTDDIKVAIKKLYQLNIIKNIKYLVAIVNGKLHTYYCANCKKRTYVDETVYGTVDMVCTHCNTDNALYFVGFKQSEKQVKHKYAI